MKTQMKIALMLGALSLHGQNSSFAQTTASPQAPKHYLCQAECFVITANGVSLTYAGGSESIRTNAIRALQDLKNNCGYPNLLLHRTLIGIKSTEQTTPVTETEYTWKQGYRFNRYHQKVTTYTVTNTETKAEFKTEEATEADSCRELLPEEVPPLRDLNGVTILG